MFIYIHTVSMQADKTLASQAHAYAYLTSHFDNAISTVVVMDFTTICGDVTMTEVAL